MDNLAYVCRESETNAVRFEIPLILVKSNAFSDEVPALLSSHRRLLCMNVKQPNKLRVLSRQGKYAETDVNASLLRHLVSSEGHLDYCAFFAVGGEDVVQLKPVIQADGEIQIHRQGVNLQEELYGVAVGDNDTVYVLGKTHVFEVDMGNSMKRAAIGLASRTVVRSPVISYHHKANLLLAPAKNNCLDLISTSSRKSVLSKVWEPHGNSIPTAAFFLQRRKFASETGNSIFIVTAARGNTELRFWSYSAATLTFSLKQDLCISIEGSGDGADVVGEEESFLINCTPTEDYITLCSRRRALAVVVELHQNFFKAVRVTSWKLQGPVLASVATVGKVAESAGRMSVDYQLMLTVRTASGFYEEVLNVEKLVGSSNTDLLNKNSVDVWFPHLDVSNNDAAAALPTALTSVSSSVLGDKTTNAVSQAVASKVVRQQAHQFCETLRSIDGRMVDLQKRASEAMRLLQEGHAREEAQTLGRKFAARNKGRLEQQQQMVESSNGVTDAQEELLEKIRSVIDEVDSLTAESVQASLKALISQRLKDIFGNGAKETEPIDLNVVFPTTRSAEHMRVFNNGADAALRLFTRSIKERTATLQASHTASTTTTTTECLSRFEDFRATLNSEVKLLARELKETADAVSRVGTAAAAVDPDVLVSRAVTAAEAKEWSAAFKIALEASDINVLLGFLEDKVCADNMSVIVQPQTIPLPTFLSLCLQLSFELDEKPESIPVRIQLLHTFYVEWDDTLKELKRKALADAGQEKVMFEVTQRELHSVLRQLELLKDHSVDRRTRNNLRLLKKLIGALLPKE